LTWTWIGPVKDDAAQFDTATLPTLARTKIASRNYYDVNVLWNASKSLELRAGIENLLDTKPIVVGTDRGPQAADTNTFQGLYDAVGRRFFAGARVRF
jgi:outer membrane receptor protein involved in Fe transport